MQFLEGELGLAPGGEGLFGHLGLVIGVAEQGQHDHPIGQRQAWLVEQGLQPVDREHIIARLYRDPRQRDPRARLLGINRQRPPGGLARIVISAQS